MFTSLVAVIGAALALSWSIARAALDISGSATCPSPAQVQAEIARRGGVTAVSDQRAELDQEPADDASPRLRLRLFDARDRLLGERALPADTHCEALAVTVATMLLSFELDIGEAPPTNVPLAPRPRAPPPPSIRHSVTYEAGAGVFFSSTLNGADDRAGAGLVLASFSIDRSRIDGNPIRLELAAELESSRGLRVGNGRASWERLWVAPGVQYRFIRRQRLWASAHLDVPLGAALASGSGLAVNRSGSIFDVGVAGGLRLGLLPPASAVGMRRKAGALPWVGVWLIYWPLQREIFLSSGASDTRLPILELLAGVGLSFGS